MDNETTKDKVKYSVRIRDNRTENTVRMSPIAPTRIIGVNVPRNYRVTFGPVVPGSKMSNGELVFRAYEGSKCRLILRNALGFWSDDVELLDENGEPLDPRTDPID